MIRYSGLPGLHTATTGRAGRSLLRYSILSPLNAAACEWSQDIKDFFDPPPAPYSIYAGAPPRVARRFRAHNDRIQITKDHSNALTKMDRL